MDPADEKLDFEEEKFKEERNYEPEEEEESFTMSHERSDSSRNVVDFQSAASARESSSVTNMKMKVIVIEPKTFDDAQQVANNLREKKPVVIGVNAMVSDYAYDYVLYVNPARYDYARVTAKER